MNCHKRYRSSLISIRSDQQNIPGPGTIQSNRETAVLMSNTVCKLDVYEIIWTCIWPVTEQLWCGGTMHVTAHRLGVFTLSATDWHVSLSAAGICGQTILCWGVGCPGHCVMLSSIPGLHSPCLPHTCSVWQLKMSPDKALSPLGTEPPNPLPWEPLPGAE